jgi:hypothetical protein
MTVEARPPRASTADVSFAGSQGGLTLFDLLDFNGRVSGKSGADTPAFADLSFQGSITPGYVPNGSNTGGTLSVTEGANTVNIALLGMYLANSFVGRATATAARWSRIRHHRASHNDRHRRSWLSAGSAA